jgi:hypothetical protein
LAFASTARVADSAIAANRVETLFGSLARVMDAMLTQ